MILIFLYNNKSSFLGLVFSLCLSMANSLPSSSLHPSMASSPPVHDDKKPPLPYIPEHIIFFDILPLLSFGELAKLKRVCKSWCKVVSSNPMLPLDRFRRCHDVSSSYSGVVFPKCDSDGQFIFLPTLRGGPLDVPDSLSVSFSPQPCQKIVACTNGLLCLKCGSNDDIYYYVCNPSTKEGHIVPLSNSWYDTPDVEVCVWPSSIGMAYDPSKSPAEYKLVCSLLHFDPEDEEKIVLGFEVFSSQTNKWDKSCNYKSCMEKQSALLNHIHFSPKSTYAGGVLYWKCCDYLMHFDPEKDYGGTVHFPFHPVLYDIDDYQIGEFKGHVTLSRVSIRGDMQLWILHLDVGNRNSTGRWELMHQVSFETVIQTNRHVFRNAFGLDMPPPKNREEVEIMFKKGLVVIHLPYVGGGRLFMRVSLRGKKKINVLCYDVNSGKLNEFSTLSPATDRWIGHALLYRSSMVSLPKLGKAQCF